MDAKHGAGALAFRSDAFPIVLEKVDDSGGGVDRQKERLADEITPSRTR
jgi:hypothetical protein